MADTKDVTVYIGRFNPFHNGHAHVLQHALQTSKLVILLLGSAGLARSLKNPFTFDERREMVSRWLATTDIPEGVQIVIAPLRDFPYNNAMWIRNVQRTVKDIIKAQADPSLKKVFITGSDRDESTWYLKAFPQWKQNLVPAFRTDLSGDLSATQIRELMFSTDISPELVVALGSMMPKSTHNFIMEFIGSPEHTRLHRWYEQNKAYRDAWSVAPYAPIFVTVDAVIIQSGHILVVERGAEPGQGLWALPGGFVKQRQRLKDAVVDETVEETGISLAEGKRAVEITKAILKGSIVDSNVYDDPDRSMRGRTITHVFLIRLDDTKPLPLVKGQNVPVYDLAAHNSAEYRALDAERASSKTTPRRRDEIDLLMAKIEESFADVHVVETAKAFWLPIDEALERSEMWFEDHHSIVECEVNGLDY
jgi:bifunctional NMN adenylyltransferase/nudix hydrolase